MRNTVAPTRRSERLDGVGEQKFDCRSRSRVELVDEDRKLTVLSDPLQRSPDRVGVIGSIPRSSDADRLVRSTLGEINSMRARVEEAISSRARQTLPVVAHVTVARVVRTLAPVSSFTDAGERGLADSCSP